MRIAGTGHRPKYFPGKYDEKDPWFLGLKENLKTKFRHHKDRIECVISGMALGWDTLLAQVAVSENIPFHAYIPFPDQYKRWPQKSQDTFKFLAGKAEKVHYTSDYYYRTVFLDRDKDMLDNCTEVYALLNPAIETGGTYYTVQLAKNMNLPITNFWPKEIDNVV